MKDACLTNYTIHISYPRYIQLFYRAWVGGNYVKLFILNETFNWKCYCLLLKLISTVVTNISQAEILSSRWVNTFVAVVKCWCVCLTLWITLRGSEGELSVLPIMITNIWIVPFSVPMMAGHQWSLWTQIYVQAIPRNDLGSKAHCRPCRVLAKGCCGTAVLDRKFRNRIHPGRSPGWLSSYLLGRKFHNHIHPGRSPGWLSSYFLGRKFHNRTHPGRSPGWLSSYFLGRKSHTQCGRTCSSVLCRTTSTPGNQSVGWREKQERSNVRKGWKIQYFGDERISESKPVERHTVLALLQEVVAGWLQASWPLWE